MLGDAFEVYGKLRQVSAEEVVLVLGPKRCPGESVQEQGKKKEKIFHVVNQGKK